jgi:hypothetical protein
VSLARFFKAGSTNAYPFSVAAATVDIDHRYQPSLRDLNNYVTALPALKSRARIKCRSAAEESRAGFDDVWEINAATAESHLLSSVGLPNSWLHLFFRDYKPAL